MDTFTTTPQEHETRRRILRGLILRMLGRAMPPAHVPQQRELLQVEPLPYSVNHKFLVQVSLASNTLSCCCSTCKQQQAENLKHRLLHHVAEYLACVDPLNCGHYTVTVTREP